jgi:hypothetical protein
MSAHMRPQDVNRFQIGNESSVLFEMGAGPASSGGVHYKQERFFDSGFQLPDLQQGDLNIRRPDGDRLANQQGNDEDQKQLGAFPATAPSHRLPPGQPRRDSAAGAIRRVPYPCRGLCPTEGATEAGEISERRFPTLDRLLAKTTSRCSGNGVPDCPARPL